MRSCFGSKMSVEVDFEDGVVDFIVDMLHFEADWAREDDVAYNAGRRALEALLALDHKYAPSAVDHGSAHRLLINIQPKRCEPVALSLIEYFRGLIGTDPLSAFIGPLVDTLWVIHGISPLSFLVGKNCPRTPFQYIQSYSALYNHNV